MSVGTVSSGTGTQDYYRAALDAKDKADKVSSLSNASVGKGLDADALMKELQSALPGIHIDVGQWPSSDSAQEAYARGLLDAGHKENASISSVAYERMKTDSEFRTKVEKNISSAINEMKAMPLPAGAEMVGCGVSVGDDGEVNAMWSCCATRTSDEGESSSKAEKKREEEAAQKKRDELRAQEKRDEEKRAEEKRVEASQSEGTPSASMQTVFLVNDRSAPKDSDSGRVLSILA